jgi:hypothetical protein
MRCTVRSPGLFFAAPAAHCGREGGSTVRLASRFQRIATCSRHRLMLARTSVSSLVDGLESASRAERTCSVWRSKPSAKVVTW